ncbi:hypothetical protein PAXINDRAFT_21270 [Paxillus involutus ATCC 200175]|uniref:Uncharacterized protein n=1 Tax=Paxillus involutus ATCC 200175 TaxID=664439 RepID=A0A0C9SM35_PAXIN|nr:hypothetical protein PAXINDRAFT_21270 [Paxillus involutus ATCC 200175]
MSAPFGSCAVWSPAESITYLCQLESASSLEPLSSGSHQLVYSPATKLAGWLEGYASHLELNVWMTTITKTEWSNDVKTWIVRQC